MFVALVPFFAFRNLSLALGEDRLRALLFSGPCRYGDFRSALMATRLWD